MVNFAIKNCRRSFSFTEKERKKVFVKDKGKGISITQQNLIFALISPFHPLKLVSFLLTNLIFLGYLGLFTHSMSQLNMKPGHTQKGLQPEPFLCVRVMSGSITCSHWSPLERRENRHSEIQMKKGIQF